MIPLIVTVLCLACAHFLPQAALAGHVRPRVDPFSSRLEESSERPLREEPDDELPSRAISAAPWLTAEGEDSPTAGEELEEAGRTSSPQPPPPNRRHRRRDNPLLQQRPPYGGGGGRESRLGHLYRRLFNRRPAQEARRAGVQRFQPERHERCDEDLDCRRSPSQVCVKRAHEPFGRCQCPYYRPVEVTVDGAVRCATARDLFDECHVTEECAAANPYLRCIHNLCVCVSPYVLRDKKDCQPANDIRPWISWLAPLLVAAVVSATSIACFVSKRRRAAGCFQPAVDQPSSVDHATAATGHTPYATSSWPPPREPCTASAGLGRREAILAWLRMPVIDYGRLREWTRFYKKAGRGADAASQSAGFHEAGAPAQDAPMLWAKRAFQLLPSPVYQGKLLQRLKSQAGLRARVASAGAPASPLAFLQKCTAGARRLAWAPQEAMPIPYAAAVSPVEQQSSLPFTPLQTTHDSQSSEPPAGPAHVSAAFAYQRRPESPPAFARSDEVDGSSFQSFPIGETPCALPPDAVEEFLRRLQRITAGGARYGGEDVRSSGASEEEPPRFVRRVTFADY